ncbi:hypothetical protein LTS14_006190 [Recurvomyces mirabilis]|nr:hypothetical protein LTS14_006190 [Recurvomyces mirabilis]
MFHLAMAWNGNPDHSLSYPERLAMIKEKAATLEEPARSAFAWIPEDTLVHRADISYWITKPWNSRKGRLTLVGDAAHAMPPYRGQGLNHCICDISNLIAGIKQTVGGERTLEQAVDTYQEELIIRGSEEVKCSLENGKMLHDWEKVKSSPVFTNGFRPMKGHDTYGNTVKTEQPAQKPSAEFSTVDHRLEENGHKDRGHVDIPNAAGDAEGASESAEIQIRHQQEREAVSDNSAGDVEAAEETAATQIKHQQEREAEMHDSACGVKAVEDTAAT